MHILLHWLYYYGGLASPSYAWYLFWSGIGADWTRLLAVGSLLGLLRQRAKHHAEMKELHERHHRELMRRHEPE